MDRTESVSAPNVIAMYGGECIRGEGAHANANCADVHASETEQIYHGFHTPAAARKNVVCGTATRSIDRLDVK